MRPSLRLVAAGALVASGYFLGTAHESLTSSVQAQAPGQAVPSASQEVEKAVTDAFSAIQTARSTLEQEGLYNPASKTVNVTAVMAGGIDSIADLESGRGVDPETFAALYAGQAIDEVASELDRDEQGRLTYKGKVIRMYSISRLRQLYQLRGRFTGADDDDDLGF